MKNITKRITAILTFVLALSLTFNAFAQSVEWKPQPNAQDTLGCVNGEASYNISGEYNQDTDELTYQYNGEGNVTDWEFPTLSEDDDYIVISKSKNSITVKKKNFEDTIPFVNAIVDFQEKNPAATEKTESTTVNELTTKQDLTTNTQTAASSTTKTEATTVPTTVEITENAVTQNTKAKGLNSVFITILIIAAAVIIAFMLLIKRKR